MGSSRQIITQKQSSTQKQRTIINQTLFTDLNTGSIVVPTIAIIQIFIKHVTLLRAKDILGMRLSLSESFVMTFQSFITIALVLAISIDLNSNELVYDFLFFLHVSLLGFGFSLLRLWVCYQLLKDKHKHLPKRFARELKSEKQQEVTPIMTTVKT